VVNKGDLCLSSAEARRASILDLEDPILGHIGNGRLGNWSGIPDRVDEPERDQVLVANVLLNPAGETLYVNTSLRGLAPFKDGLNRVVVSLAVLVLGRSGLRRRKRSIRG